MLGLCECGVPVSHDWSRPEPGWFHIPTGEPVGSRLHEMWAKVRGRGRAVLTYLARISVWPGVRALGGGPVVTYLLRNEGLWGDRLWML